ncbi:MAG: serine hydrolase [Luteimonas sp.]|nr:serine hydrolase [Luteimonas sp.]
MTVDLNLRHFIPATRTASCDPRHSHAKIMKTILIAAIALLSPSLAAAQDACLQRTVERSGPYADLHGQLVISTLMEDGKRETRVLTGNATAQTKLTGNEGFCIASITKTYVAATVLRLWEDGSCCMAGPARSTLRRPALRLDVAF